MKSYIETTITVSPYNSDIADLITALLADLGYDSFVSTASGVECYIPSDSYIDGSIESVLEYVPESFTIEYKNSIVEESDWNSRWVEESFTPIEINNNCIIHHPKDNIKEGVEFDILIKPIMAFGSGHHATTSMISNRLFSEDIKGKTVLDVGCGTGILSIIASKLGASEVVGVDIDKSAYLNAIENVTLNLSNNISLFEGGVEVISNKKFDMVLANINRNILVENMKNYSNLLNESGELIVSGFYIDDLKYITAEAEKYNIKFVDKEEKEGWISAKYQKNWYLNP